MKELIKHMDNNEIDFSLFGLALGDGYLTKRKRICIEHTSKQDFYCEWLYNIFNERIKVWKYNNYNKNTSLGVYKYSRVEITPNNRDMFYSNNIFLNLNRKKIISDYVLSNITPLGLLFWYLDDGSLSIRPEKGSRFALLATHGFTYDENINIKEMFKERFDIDLRINQETKQGKVYYKLYFSSTSFRKFYDLLFDYIPLIPVGFHYKFDMKYIPNMSKESDIFSQRYNLNHLKVS